MTTAAASSVQAPVYTWSPTHVVVEENAALVNQGSTVQEFAQLQGPNARMIEPRPGSLYGYAVGKTMVLPTGPTLLPNYPPAQEILERPQYVPGQGWVNTLNSTS